MSQQEEYQKLARKFVDVWQEQMAAMLNDGEFIRTLLSMMQGSGFSAKDNIYAYSNTSQPSGGAATASDSRDAALASLAYSLAAIEKRLERLEQRSTGSVSPARRKTKKRVGNAVVRPATGKGRRTGSKKPRRPVS